MPSNSEIRHAHVESAARANKGQFIRFSQGSAIPTDRRNEFFEDPNNPDYYVGGMCHALALYWMAHSLNNRSFWDWITPDKKTFNANAVNVIISETILYKNDQGVRIEFTGETKDELVNGFLSKWGIIPSTGQDARDGGSNVGVDPVEKFEPSKIAKLVTNMKDRGFMISFSRDGGGHALAAHSTSSGGVKFFDANYGEFIFSEAKDFENFFPLYMEISNYSDKYKKRWSIKRYKKTK